jgi:putative MATE family efflux protein
MNKSLTRDMTSGSPTKLLLKFSLPMLLGNVIQQLYNMVDLIVVGKFVGKDALAAVGATGSMIFLIIGLAFGLSGGISIVISQYFGAQDYDNVKKAYATAVYTVVGASIIMGLLGFFTSRFMLELLKTPASIIDQSEMYMKITFAGILGVTSYNGIAAVLRALGDSITPLIFLALASVLNVLLDLLFVVVFHWDVPGVAIATVISQIISAVGCIIYAMARIKLLRIPLKDFKPDKVIFKKCLRLGLPVSIQNVLISVSLMALQGVINGYQEVVIAASAALSRIEQLVLMPGMSLGAALASFAGQNVGAGKHDRANQGYRAASCIIVMFSLFMLPVMYFGGEYIMKLFVNVADIEVVEIGVKAIRITSLFYSALGMILVSSEFLSGTGDINIPIAMGITEVICRIVLANILTIYYSFEGIWWATAINWLITAIVGIFRVASGKWTTNSIIQKQAKPLSF